LGDGVDFDAVFPVLTLVAGAVLTYVAETVRYRRSRRDQLSDALVQQRAAAYRQFLLSAHAAAHLLGRAAGGSETPLTAVEAPDVHARVDSDVSRDLLELEVIATPQVLEAARQVRARLRDFRAVVAGGSAYMSEEYRAALGQYQLARTGFVEQARREVLT